MYRRSWSATTGARAAATRSRSPAASPRSRAPSWCCCAALELDPLATPADAYERAMAEAEERLSAAAREVLGETPFRLRTIGGVAAPRALHEVAEDERADVIVLGSTHREGLGRVLPGQRRRAPPARGAVRGAGRAERVRRARAARDPHDRRRLRRPHRGRARARGRRGARRRPRRRRSRRSRSREDDGDPAEVARLERSRRARPAGRRLARLRARSATRCSAASPRS